MRTSGIAAAQVAFHDLAGIVVVVDRAEWAGNGADFAADANVFQDNFRAGFLVYDDGFNRASVETPGFSALRAGVRHLAAFMVEIENLDDRLRRIDYPKVFERTGHFTLQTAGAYVRVDKQ